MRASREDPGRRGVPLCPGVEEKAAKVQQVVFMADKNKEKAKRLLHRKWSGRAHLYGTSERPRLCVHRSSKHIYAQLIDDHEGRTLASSSSSIAEVRGELKNGGNVAAARRVGTSIAQRAKAAGITKVAFDRNGRKYHGRVKALAYAARKGGLSF